MTLLGLAVAILAGVAVLYWIGRSAPEKIVPLTPSSEVATTTAEAADPRAGWQTYTDPEYAFSVQFPPGWIVATGTINHDPVITLAPGELNASSTTSYHEGLTRVSIYPIGRSIHASTTDEEQQSTVILQVPQASAKDYQLSSKRSWATIGRFDVRPDSWTAAGYVFARASIENESLTYYHGDATTTEDSFDPAAGDRVVHEGYVDPTVRGLEEEILKSFTFTQSEQPATSTVSDLIQVDQPKEGDRVASPLTVKGKARGSWYFEGSFPVRLETDAGAVLAEVPATAQGEWMTDDFVPFELSLAFSTTTATSGVLILKKDNPSGLTTLDMETRIPVLFANE
jgi:hypothetical protein